MCTASAVAMAVFAAGAAQATVLVNQPHDPTARAPTDTSFAINFNSTGGAGSIAFTIDGYGSLDGQISGEDDFTLTLNGAVLVNGTWNLGGGGQDVVFSAPGDATFVNHTAPPPAFGGGGTLDVQSSLNLAAGANTLVFAYHSVEGPGFLGFEGAGNEGWGIQNLVVNGAGDPAPPLTNPPAGVPEPATWALMLIGFGGIGATLRRRRQVLA